MVRRKFVYGRVGYGWLLLQLIRNVPPNTGGQTVASITAFVLLMCLHPDAQARAQKEIDEVVGSDRLPTAEDEERLPYLSALIKEVLRYWTIAPIGKFTAQEFSFRAY